MSTLIPKFSIDLSVSFKIVIEIVKATEHPPFLFLYFSKSCKGPPALNHLKRMGSRGPWKVDQQPQLIIPAHLFGAGY